MRQAAIPHAKKQTLFARAAEPALLLLAHTPRRFQEMFRRVARTLLSGLAARSGGEIATPQVGDWIAVLGAPWIAPGMAEAVLAVKRREGVRVALLVHDLLPATSPQWFSDAQGEAAKRDVEMLIHKADLLCAVSTEVVTELRDRYGKKAFLLMPADPELQSLGSPSSSPNNGERIVLCVGTLHPRKNLLALVKIWEEWVERSAAGAGHLSAVPLLYLVGRRHPQDGELFKALTDHPRAASRIRLVHDADDAQLASLYSACRFLVMPSLAEGWGLPIREALISGRPAIATDAVPAASGSKFVRVVPAGDDAQLARAIVEWWEGDIPEQMSSEIIKHFIPRRWPQVAEELGMLLNAEQTFE
jgi:glycosyltransferase involved in cell wall biosynthesis